MKKGGSYLQNFDSSSMLRQFKKLSNPVYLPITLVSVLAFLMLLYFYSSKEGFHCKPSELDQHIQSSEPTLVLFYADWCGHCTKLKPTWEEAAKKANIEKNRMIQLDVGGKTPEQKALMDKYEIDGFPTIMVFQNGVATPYQGTRTTEAFLQSLGS